MLWVQFNVIFGTAVRPRWDVPQDLEKKLKRANHTTMIDGNKYWIIDNENYVQANVRSYAACAIRVSTWSRTCCGISVHCTTSFSRSSSTTRTPKSRDPRLASASPEAEEGGQVTHFLYYIDTSNINLIGVNYERIYWQIKIKSEI